VIIALEQSFDTSSVDQSPINEVYRQSVYMGSSHVSTWRKQSGSLVIRNLAHVSTSSLLPYRNQMSSRSL
jgi:hypothetical protein